MALEKESASGNYSSAALFKVEILVEQSRRPGIIFSVDRWLVGMGGFVEYFYYFFFGHLFWVKSFPEIFQAHGH